MTAAYQSLRVETVGRVVTITLDRPAALNALSTRMLSELSEAVLAADADRGVGAIVITGSQRAFAAGADIAEMASKDYAEVFLDDWLAGWDRLAAVRTPLIAAVSGYALGGGCELAMMCDLILASDTARFGQPEITLGIIPGMGGSQRLTRAIGIYKAKDLVLTGRTMDAEEAERAGLVSRVVPQPELLSTAAEVAATIASRSLPAVYAAKEAVDAALDTTLTAGLRVERRAFHSAFALEDQTEGMAAFLEKRAPQFRHR